MFKKKTCPVCGDKHKYIGLTRKYADGFFGFFQCWIGFEVIYKCQNGHVWSKNWWYEPPSVKK